MIVDAEYEYFGTATPQQQQLIHHQHFIPGMPLEDYQSVFPTPIMQNEEDNNNKTASALKLINT